MKDPHAPPRRWTWRTTPPTAWALLVGVLSCGVVSAQNQNAANALNLFQQLLRPAQNAAPAPQPVNPALPANAAGFLGNALGGATGTGAGKAAMAGDLMNLLSQSTTQIEPAQEIEIGRQLSAILLGSKALHPDMQLQRYVNQLGRWLSLQTSRPELPWTFAVLDDDGFNAFAAPGGFVFVTKGLIDRVADESELAGILAHEITHVVQRHHLEAIRKNARAGIVTQLIGSQLNNNLGGALSAQLIGLGRNLYSKGLDQEDEYEADRLGVTLAASSGFDPYGLPAVLQQLRDAAPDNPVFSLSLSTHPPAQLRIDQMALAMGTQLDALTGKPAITLAERMEQLSGRRSDQNAATAPAATVTAPAAAKPPPAVRLPAARPATAKHTKPKP
jgi:predicted Zn-dependent protease